MLGTVAKINLAYRRTCRTSPRIKDDSCAALKGRIQIGPKSTTSSAPSTNRSTVTSRKQPYLEVTIPSLTDPSLAPRGKHVMSIYMQYAPYKLKTATGRRTAQRARR